MKLQSDTCLYTLFEAHAAAQPTLDAVVFNDDRLSYSALNEQSNQLAHYLVGKGIAPESLVAIYVDRSIEMVIAILAVHKAGGAYIPLDPDLPVERLLYMVKDCNAAVLLAQRSLSGNIEQMALDIDAIYLDDENLCWADEATHNPNVDSNINSLAYVLYTSGSTGKPKGVMIEHSQLIHYTLAVNQRLGITARMSFAMVQPFTVDSSVTVLQSSLVTGGVLHILSKEITLDPDAFERYFAKHTIDCLKLAPSHLSALLPQSVLPKKVLIVGGEALKWSLVSQLDLRDGPRLFNHYGPTETTVGVLTYQVDPQNVIDTPSGSVPIGTPLANTRAYILDQHMNTVPIGVVGELYIGGPLLARGYLNLPEQTDASFVSDPHDPTARLYRTGDLAHYLDNGDIEYLGRADNQLKVRGYRLEPGEIEQVIVNDSRVKEAVVTGYTTPGNQTELVAYIVPHDHNALNKTLVDRLRSSLVNTLPSYMVPTHWQLLDELPRSRHGKLNIGALPAPNLESALSTNYIAPTTDQEKAIASIWAAAIGVEHVGLQDNFFELGGDSLTIMKVMPQMHQHGLNLTAQTLYLVPTIAELISCAPNKITSIDVPPNHIPDPCNAITPEMLTLVKLGTADIDTIVSAVPGGVTNIKDIYPLAPLQDGFLFLHMISPDTDPYVTTLQYGFNSRERLDAYVDAVQQVIDRHDVLRTAFLWEDLPMPVQVVIRQAPLLIHEIATDNLVGDVAEWLVRDLDAHYYRLDICNAQAMRLLIAKDAANDRWILQSIIHHLIGDQITTANLEREIRALLSNKRQTLPAPIPFRNFVAQSRHSIESSDYKKYFNEALGDITEPTTPYDIVDTQSEEITKRSKARIVDQSLAARIRKFCRSIGVTPASLFHLAWGHVLAGLCGLDDVVFGTVLLGRINSGGDGIEQMVGPCINTLPIRINLGDALVLDAINKTHRTLAELMAYEYAPLAETQGCSSVPAPKPLFSTILNYRHSTESSLAEYDEPALQGRVFIGSYMRGNYPISVNIDDGDDKFSVDVRVEQSINPTRICDYLCTSIENLIEALESSPNLQIDEVEFIPESEQRQLQVGWNAAHSD